MVEILSQTTATVIAVIFCWVLASQGLELTNASSLTSSPQAFNLSDVPPARNIQL